jgi:hypothetical protein
VEPKLEPQGTTSLVKAGAVTQCESDSDSDDMNKNFIRSGFEPGNQKSAAAAARALDRAAAAPGY